MKKSRFSDSQILAILKTAKKGVAKHSISIRLACEIYDLTGHP
ncbi:hypothetical protein [Microbulbifer agarilyticus]|nr:hypothetical protein [Microbulbifer agarilyticus]